MAYRQTIRDVLNMTVSGVCVECDNDSKTILLVDDNTKYGVCGGSDAALGLWDQWAIQPST